jgi:hypothetical protein
MSFLSVSSGFSIAVLVAVLARVIVVGMLTIYALYKGGEVNAEFSYGRTHFKLEARDREALKLRRNN